MLAPYFFHKTRVQKSVEEICTLFFSRVVAQDSPGATIRVWECSFTCKEIERSESRLRAFIEAC